MAHGYYDTSRRVEALLDELLCEYVDGTVDRAVRAAFDECMSEDKGLAERVECLRRIRRLLKQHRCREARGVRLRVRQRLVRELCALQEDAPFLRSLSPLLIVALVACAMLIAGTAGHAPAPVAVQSMELEEAGALPMTLLPGPVHPVPVLLASEPPLVYTGIEAQETVP